MGKSSLKPENSYFGALFYSLLSCAPPLEAICRSVLIQTRVKRRFPPTAALRGCSHVCPLVCSRAFSWSGCDHDRCVAKASHSDILLIVHFPAEFPAFIRQRRRKYSASMPTVLNPTHGVSLQVLVCHEPLNCIRISSEHGFWRSAIAARSSFSALANFAGGDRECLPTSLCVQHSFSFEETNCFRRPVSGLSVRQISNSS